MKKHTVYLTFLLSLLALPWSSGQRLPGKVLLVSREMWEDGVEDKEILWLHMKSQGTKYFLLTIGRCAQAKVTHVKIFFLRSTGPVYKESCLLPRLRGKTKIWKYEFLSYFSFLLLWLDAFLNQSSELCSFSFSTEGLTSHVTVQCFTLAISFSNILLKTLKFEISGT